MTEAEIYAELRAIREVLDILNNRIGALTQSMHNPGDCKLSERVAILEKQQSRWAGGLASLLALASVLGGGIAFVIGRIWK